MASGIWGKEPTASSTGWRRRPSISGRSCPPGPPATATRRTPRSSFAANELFIDLHQLVEAGYLEARALDHVPSFREDRVDFPAVTAFKMPHLKAAALAFIRAGHTERGPYRAFCTAQRFWLDDYALFRTIAEEWGDSRWMSHWSRELGQRDATALRRFTDEHRQEIEVWRVLQYFFDVQWKSLKAYANACGIRLIGDVPIFVASDSSDTWQHPHLFKRNAEGVFDPVSGVPPDIFSDTGQLWGNPVYDWPVHRASGYQWWIERMKRLFSLTDMVRVDHFRGFEATYEIPADHVTAEFGSWVKADGVGLFEAIESKLGHLEIIAEDLGLMNDEVLALRDGHNFPGMKILQFAFTTTETGEPNYHDDFYHTTGASGSSPTPVPTTTTPPSGGTDPSQKSADGARLPQLPQRRGCPCDDPRLMLSHAAPPSS